MRVQEMFEVVLNSTAFKEWEKTHQESFLSSFFITHGGGKREVQLDFYNTPTDTISSFALAKENVSLLQDEETIVKEKEVKISKLDLSQVAIEEERVRETVRTVKESKYERESISKIILILQNLDRPLWNVNAITNSCNLLHLKINAATGEVMEEKFDSIISLKGSRQT